MFGMLVSGDEGQTVIGDGYTVMTQRLRGKLVVTHVPGRAWKFVINRGIWWERTGAASYGYCEVVYPTPVYSIDPPLVFATPTYKATNRGIGLFCHRGSPGNWTGFSTVVTQTTFCTSSAAMSVGFDSGWDYRVCVFGDPGVGERPAFGLRLLSENSEEFFNSGWPLVPFRGLLESWDFIGFTRSYAAETHWGWRYIEGNPDNVLGKGSHSWDGTDTTGILLSSLTTIPTSHDIGDRYNFQGSVITIGFPDSNRDKLWSVMHNGRSQHPSGDIREMNKWRLLTADFSHV